MKRSVEILILILFYLTLEISAQKTFYVSTQGSDTSSGDLNHPFRTIQEAINQSEGGDRILIYPGDYSERITLNMDSLIIDAFNPDEKPVIIGNGSAFDSSVNAVIKWTSNEIHPYHNNVINNLIIRDVTANEKICGIWINGDYNTIKNCELENINRSGIVVQGNHNTIENNIVDDINGAQNGLLRGNNISVESVYKPDTVTLITYRQNSEYNVIRNNILKNNPTHFGVNIFPNTQDPLQPIMYGNKIYSNYIESTGGGIYTRYQRNMEIINNIIVGSTFSSYWDTQGSAIIFDDKSADPAYHILPFNAISIKIYNNTLADNQQSGIRNMTSAGLKIYNNIFKDNGTGENSGHISFDRAFANTEINNNLYSGTDNRWRWDADSSVNLEDWISLIHKDSSSIFSDPLFTTYQGIDYALDYSSPAKNKGKGLAFYGVTTDKFGNPRPYWNKNYDIGAFEVEDTQLKIGVTGLDTLDESLEITHTITSVGSLWERNVSGSTVSWDISSNQTLQSASYTTIGNSTENLDSLGGIEYKWLDRSDDDTGQRIAAGFYKVTNDYNPDAYFYLDLRDAVTNNNYIQYYHETGNYRYYKDHSWGNPITNGSVLGTWEINDNNRNTSSLASYWRNSLVLAESYYNNIERPLLIWGSPSTFTATNYLIYRAISDQPVNPANLTFTIAYTVDYNTHSLYDLDVRLDQTPIKYIYYYVKAYNQTNSDSTNLMSTDGAFLPQKKNHEYASGKPIINYSLKQNYPNPFNPTTRLSYSIAKEENVIIKIYDCLGREIRTLVNEVRQPGVYRVDFNAEQLSSGVYFYRITAGKYTEVKKMQLIK